MKTWLFLISSFLVCFSGLTQLWADERRDADIEAAEIHYSLGLSRYDDGELEEAISEFQEAIKLNPNFVEAHLKLGLSYGEIGNVEEAEKEFKRVVELNPKNLDANYYLGLIYLDQEKFDEAIQHFNRATEINPKQPGSHAFLGYAYLGKGDPDKAISYLKKSLDLEPQNAEVHIGLGGILLNLNRINEAKLEFEKALEIEPQNPEATRILGLIHSQIGDWNRAIELFSNLVKQQPTHPESYLLLGEAYEGKGELDKAKRLYQILSKLNPNLLEAHTRLALIYGMMGQNSEAELEYKRALEISPDEALIYNNLAWLYVQKDEKLPAALRLASKAVEIEPDSPAYLDTLAWSYLKNGEHKRALEVIQEVFKIDPLSNDTWKALSSIAMSDIPKETFTSFIKNISEIQNSNPLFKYQLHSTMAHFYRYRGDKNKVKSELKEMGLENPIAWMILGPFKVEGFDENPIPPSAINLKDSYNSDREKVKWKKSKEEASYGYLNLKKELNADHSSMSYALIRFKSDSEKEAQLRVGSSGGIKIWLNKDQVISKDIVRFAAPDQEIVPIKVKQGENQFLIATYYKFGDWDLYFRLTDLSGNPANGITYK